MREIKYLSPSSYMLWHKDRESFYMDKLAANRPERIAQTQPMSIGSAFDAYTKSYLHGILIGNDPKFEFQTLFEAQVEPHNRDWALVHGKQAFVLYRQSGALADLLLDLQRASGVIRFEDSVEGVVNGVPLLGKPDCYFINGAGHPVVLDWKVNGWCGNSNTSPKPGYVRMRTCHEDTGMNQAVMHKDCWPEEFKGVRINKAKTLDQIDRDWATQLAIYGWLDGEEPGNEFVCAIDQLACKAMGVGGVDFPDVRIAEHRLLLNRDFQINLMHGLKLVWDAIQSGHIFNEVTREESDAKCAILEERAAGFADSPELAAMCRRHKGY